MFQSDASTLVSGDTNGKIDVYVRDVSGETTERVSVSTYGVEADADSTATQEGSVSASGRVVVFASLATNLVSGATNGQSEIYIRDRRFATTHLVSHDLALMQSNGPSRSPSLSADGRFIAYRSSATNLVVGDTNGADDVFLLDCRTGFTERISIDSAEQQANAGSYGPCVSGDGRFVVFYSDASDLVVGDTNAHSDVFLRDRRLGTTTRLSVDSAGLQADSDSSAPSIANGGRHIVFQSRATNLVVGDTNAMSDIFVHDCLTLTTERVSITTSGAQGNGSSVLPTISANGRFVAFQTLADDLVGGDTNGVGDVVVRDRRTGESLRVNIDTAGSQGDLGCGSPSISADGRIVVFHGSATNLVASDTNAFADVFAFGPEATPILPYCFGDGTTAVCPCGNMSGMGSGEGCLNSMGRGGLLTGSGVASLALDTITLEGVGMPGRMCVYFQGSTPISGGSSVVLGDGLRCSSGFAVRLATCLNTGGASSYPTIGQDSISLRGNCQAGLACTYQVWYRDEAAFCTSASFNLTNALQLTWAP